MTRPQGGFADRGVHLARGKEITVILTPSLALMCCQRCHRRGVTVTALAANDRMLGWCTLGHARLDGLCQPAGNVLPAPRSRRRVS